ncbi:hypothetical protein L914_21691, partial [Phytophthora nicotianae]
MATPLNDDDEPGDEDAETVPGSEIAQLTTAVTQLVSLLADVKAATERQPPAARSASGEDNGTPAEQLKERAKRHVVTTVRGDSGDTATEVARLQPAPRRREVPVRGGAAQRRVQYAREDGSPGDTPPDSSDDGHDDDDPDESGDDGANAVASSSSEGDSESDDGRERRGQRRRERRNRRKNVKDLELPTFIPSPKVSVSTWIDRVDLALKGAEESGRGRWSDKALYYILGNKLMENAATWWVNRNRSTPTREKTWTHLKEALLQRYAEKLDKSQAEWRVSMRRFLPGESYADFAAGLREVIGRNRVSERVLLAQFYRCLDKTTKQLVKQDPRPTTLEAAVKKANEVDDPMENVAQGMMN